MTPNEKVLKRALELACGHIYRVISTYSYHCSHCPCSKEDDRYRTCFGKCEKEIAKEFKNRAIHEALLRKAKKEEK